MKTKQLLIPILFSGMVACGGGDDKDEGANGTINPYQGIWTSSVNGETFEISNNSVQIYQHNSRFCLIASTFENLDNSDFSNTFDLSENGQQLAVIGSDGTAELYAPIVQYGKAESLPATCNNPIAKLGEEGYQRDPVRDLDLFGQTFSDFYLSFDLKQVDWQTNFQEALATTDNNTSDAELMDTLVQLVSPLADAHVHISSDQFGEFSADGKPTLIARLIEEFVESNVLNGPLSQVDIDALNNYVEDQLNLRQDIIFSYADEGTIKSAANDQLIWFSSNNIAYLFIGSMSGYGSQDDADIELAVLEEALDLILSDIQDAEGLIIDLRTNNGGRDFLSMAIASRFVGGQHLAFSKQSRDGNHRTALEEVYIEPRGNIQYLGPITLLVSNSTVSAAEVFTLMMRSLSNVTLVGESTQGALSDSLEKILPNGFKFSLSNQYYFSDEGEWFEDTGIPVDIETPFFSVDERIEEIDVGIETAYSFLVDEL